MRALTMVVFRLAGIADGSRLINGGILRLGGCFFFEFLKYPKFFSHI